jgi:hypothetical protein
MTKAAELAKMGDVLTNGQIGGRRNIVINGAMGVSQRSTSVTGLGDGDEGYVTLDRFRHTAAASAGRFTSAQTAVTDLPGFLNCLHLDCTTADTSIAATELLVIEHRIEGQDLQQLRKGTADAEKVTVSFYMKTNAEFVFMCVLNDFDNNRVNTQKFTTTTGWTRHSITFAGDTTGTLNDDNGLSLSVSIYLHAGSNFTGGTYVSNTWQSRASSDNMIAPGIGSFYSSTDNDVKLTGLQLELGSQATPFEHRSFGEELALCQRYYVQIGPYPSSQGAGALAIFATADANSGFSLIDFPVYMRAEPTLTHTGTATDYNLYVANAHKAGSGGFSVSSGDTLKHTLLYTEHSNTTTAGQVGTLTTASNNTDAFLGFVAEL